MLTDYLLTFLNRRRARLSIAKDLAAEIVAQAGDDAYALIRIRMAGRVRNRQDVTLETLVKREIDALLGVKPRLDTATRYLEHDRRTRR